MNAFHQQLNQQIPALRRYARSLLHQSVAADDLVQDCLARALERQHQWRPDSNLRAWLFTLMHNLFINQVNKRKRQPDEISLEELELGSTQQPDGLTRQQQIQRQMAALPFAQREVIALVALEGFSYQEVATILDVPIGTVMSRLHRAREALRNALEVSSNTSLRRVK